jgi:hypothetical protein
LQCSLLHCELGDAQLFAALDDGPWMRRIVHLQSVTSTVIILVIDGIKGSVSLCFLSEIEEP